MQHLILCCTDVKAVSSLAHDATRFYYGADAHGISALKIPSLYFAASEDTYGGPEVDAMPCYDQSPSPSYLLNLVGAGHIGFTDVMNDGPMEIERMHKAIRRTAAAFFLRYLKDDSSYDDKLKNKPADAWGDNAEDIEWSWK